MDADQIARACARMAHQVLEANRGAEGLVVLGIPTRGVALAERLARAMADVEGVDIPVGALDVTFYPDDLRRHPTRAVGRSRLPVGVDDAVVVLVDDVLFSGCTVPAALDALGDLGRPRAVRLGGLGDRRGSASGSPSGGARGPRPPRAADPRRPRGQEFADPRRRARPGASGVG